MATPANPITPEQRRQRAQLANAVRWSRLPRAERAAQTAKARAALAQKYLDAVPEHVTDPAEREALARQAHHADLLRWSLKAHRARTAKAAARKAGAARARRATG